MAPDPLLPSGKRGEAERRFFVRHLAQWAKDRFGSFRGAEDVRFILVTTEAVFDYADSLSERQIFTATSKAFSRDSLATDS